MQAPMPPHHHCKRSAGPPKTDAHRHATRRQLATRTMPPPRATRIRPDRRWRKLPHIRNTTQPTSRSQHATKPTGSPTNAAMTTKRRLATTCTTLVHINLPQRNPAHDSPPDDAALRTQVRATTCQQARRSTACSSKSAPTAMGRKAPLLASAAALDPTPFRPRPGGERLPSSPLKQRAIQKPASINLEAHPPPRAHKSDSSWTQMAKSC